MTKLSESSEFTIPLKNLLAQFVEGMPINYYQLNNFEDRTEAVACFNMGVEQ